MGMLVLEMEGVPCCESHEQAQRAVRGTGKEGGGDREESAWRARGAVDLTFSERVIR